MPPVGTVNETAFVQEPPAGNDEWCQMYVHVPPAACRALHPTKVGRLRLQRRLQSTLHASCHS